MFRSSIVGFWLFIITIASFQAQAGPGSQTRALLQLSGIDVVFDTIAGPLKEQSSVALRLPPEMEATWNEAVDANFVGSEMFEETLTLVEGKLSEDEIEALIAYYDSAPGRKITALEVAAQREDEAVNMQKGLEILQGFGSADHPRVASYRELAEATQAIETATALSLTISYAVVSGMASASEGVAAPSDAEIWALVSGQREQMKSAMEAQIFMSFAYTYRDLSDQELAAYVAFLETVPAKHFYNEVMLAISGVLSRHAEKFGQDMMIASGKRQT